MTALSLDGVRVLVVEDDYMVADSLRYLLESFGGRVTIVPSADRALEALGVETTDVAVLDINLRGSSVVPLAEILQDRGVPFVFVTGYGDTGMLPAHLRDCPRLNKPARAESLVETLLALAQCVREP